MKKEYPMYYDYFIALYKVRLFWYSMFGTAGLIIIRALLSFNLAVYLIMEVPLLIFLIWAIIGFIRLIQLDFTSFCAFIGGEAIYEKVEADYQHALEDLPEGFVGKTYFIKKNPQLKTHYEAADFFIKHNDVSWAYYQTIQQHVFGIGIRKIKTLQVFAYDGILTLVLRKQSAFDYADFIEEQGVSFILGYSKEREAMYEAQTSKQMFIHTVVQAEQAIVQEDSAGPIYNKPLQEIAIVNYRTLAEQIQYAREQLMNQLLGGRTRAIEHQATAGEEDIEPQTALDLDTASYQVLDATAEMSMSEVLEQLTLKTPSSQEEREQTTIEEAEQLSLDEVTLEATEGVELTVETANAHAADEAKHRTNGGTI